MATYFVRKTGSDANAGTSKTTAFVTIGKAASTVAAGDTVWIGAGTYREAVSLSTAGSAGNIITWNGDVDGAQTGDSGEIQWTGYLKGERGTGGTAPLTLAAKHFNTFNKLTIAAGNAGTIVAATSTHDIAFQDCAIMSGASNNNPLINPLATAGVALNWTIDRCIFSGGNAFGSGNSGQIYFTAPTQVGADYDLNVLIQNCMFLSGGNTQVGLNGTGAAGFNPGGITMKHCTSIGAGNCFFRTDGNTSTTIPCNVYNTYLYAQVRGIQANSSGQIIEDHNLYVNIGIPRTNVSTGAHSIDTVSSGLIHMGQEALWGGEFRPFGTPVKNSPLLGFGAQASGPTYDFLNLTRPSGFSLQASGTATAGASKTITDSGATFGVNTFNGMTIVLTGGTGSGQTKSITSNTNTVITVDGNWKTTPDNTSTYEVIENLTSSTGTATSGSTTSLTDSNASWGVNAWTGAVLHIDSGTGSGQTLAIASNTATAISFATATAPDNTSTYSLYRNSAIAASDYSVGAYERHDIAEKELVVTDAGGVGIRMTGPGDHRFQIPVAASAITVSVRSQHDTAHGNTNKPQMIIEANGEVGVTLTTVTATQNAGIWETLSTTFTPTAGGIITMRLVSRAAVANGIAYFDTVGVS